MGVGSAVGLGTGVGVSVGVAACWVSPPQASDMDRMHAATARAAVGLRTRPAMAGSADHIRASQGGYLAAAEAVLGQGLIRVLAEGRGRRPDGAGGIREFEGKPDLLGNAGDGVLQFLDHPLRLDVGVLVHLLHVPDRAVGHARVVQRSEPVGGVLFRQGCLPGWLPVGPCAPFGGRCRRTARLPAARRGRLALQSRSQLAWFAAPIMTWPSLVGNAW